MIAPTMKYADDAIDPEAMIGCSPPTIVVIETYKRIVLTGGRINDASRCCQRIANEMRSRGRRLSNHSWTALGTRLNEKRLTAPQYAATRGARIASVQA
jgi:hypothetical protein